MTLSPCYSPPSPPSPRHADQSSLPLYSFLAADCSLVLLLAKTASYYHDSTATTCSDGTLPGGSSLSTSPQRACSGQPFQNDDAPTAEWLVRPRSGSTQVFPVRIPAFEFLVSRCSLSLLSLSALLSSAGLLHIFALIFLGDRVICPGQRDTRFSSVIRIMPN